MMDTRKRRQFIVRALTDDSDLARCMVLDHSYATDYVWQMDEREENEEMVVRFRSVRLPRTMQVAYPRDTQELAQSWKKRDGFLVASTDEIVLGYANMRIDAGQTTAWIHDLVVDEPFRRRRIGSALLEQATRWALLRRVRYLTLEVQTKNHPGITLARSQGFQFCGFNDHYYTNQDIALFFAKTL